MVVGKGLRFLMICKCSSWGRCMRDGIFCFGVTFEVDKTVSY